MADHFIIVTILCVLAGTGLGLLYFWGLWWTVRKLPLRRHRSLWLLGSFWLRMGAGMAAFYLIMDGRWERLLACLLGFMAIRLVMVRRLGLSAEPEN